MAESGRLDRRSTEMFHCEEDLTVNRLAANGMDNGPCASCTHLECIAARQIASEACRLCQMPIGNAPFYAEPDKKAHRACVEEELTRKLRAGLRDCEVKFLTVDEVAEMLHVQPASIRNWGFD